MPIIFLIVITIIFVVNGLLDGWMLKMLPVNQIAR